MRLKRNQQFKGIRILGFKDSEKLKRGKKRSKKNPKIRAKSNMREGGVSQGELEGGGKASKEKRFWGSVGETHPTGKSEKNTRTGKEKSSFQLRERKKNGSSRVSGGGGPPFKRKKNNTKNLGAVPYEDD